MREDQMCFTMDMTRQNSLRQKMLGRLTLAVLLLLLWHLVDLPPRLFSLLLLLLLTLLQPACSRPQLAALGSSVAGSSLRELQSARVALPLLNRDAATVRTIRNARTTAQI